MNKNFDKNIHLTEHFTLDEMCKTSIKTKEGNIPSSVHIENLKRLCVWLEQLRAYPEAYPQPLPKGGESGLQGGLGESSSKVNSIENTNPRSGNALLPSGGVGGGLPIYINSGYRSPAVNRAVGGVATSNHLTGCAADIRCTGLEQAFVYAYHLLMISRDWKEDFDELLVEQSSRSTWIHFAVRASGNRRKVAFKRV